MIFFSELQLLALQQQQENLSGHGHGVPSGTSSTSALAAAEAAYRERYAVLRSVYESRLRAAVAGVLATAQGAAADASVTTLAADAASAPFVPVRALALPSWAVSAVRVWVECRLGWRSWWAARWRRSGRPPSPAWRSCWRCGRGSCGGRARGWDRWTQARARARPQQPSRQPRRYGTLAFLPIIANLYYW
jgi:hypothetical protein